MLILADGILREPPNYWTIIGILIGAVAALLGGYFRKAGEFVFQRQVFEQVLHETVQTRVAVQQVEAKFARSRFLGENEIAYRERQLAEFYGPIYGTIKSNEGLWALWTTPALEPIAAQVLEHFRNEGAVIIQILKSKAHLVEGEAIPPCFADFMASATIFTLGTRAGGGFTPERIAKLPEASFPQTFVDYITETTESLKKKLNQLYKRHGYTEQPEAT